MKTPSALLKHEIAYCIGQLEDPYALPFLSTVLENKEENSMVRHEAGEALGAIGDVAALPVLKKHRDDADNCTEVNRAKVFVAEPLLRRPSLIQMARSFH